MPGAYNMLSQNIKGGKVDTTYKTLQQMKIFTDEYVMYANVNPPDSVSSFGIGTYSTDKDTINETIIFRSADTSRSETPSSFKLGIETTLKGYKQVIPNIGTQGDQKLALTETYESIGTQSKSALDGAWKLMKASYIKGKDTSIQKVIQYKIYNAGHFVWGQSYEDSLKKNHTGIGFGKFELNGNKLKEYIMSSTYSTIRDLNFEIDIVMDGVDGFSQTITNKDSSKSVEVYQRLKK